MAFTKKDIAAAKFKLAQAKTDWRLTEDGDLFATKLSLLQPVLWEGRNAMLKIPMHPEERRTFPLLTCWNGEGAVKVLRFDDKALLMERATGLRSLRQMVLNGNEKGANQVICDVAAKLHRSPCSGVPGLVPLKQWFKSLFNASAKEGGLFRDCGRAADFLLDKPQDVAILHGDIHYDNVLDSGHSDWLAIDPKGLIGERGFDFANLFCNPTPEIAMSATRLEEQSAFVAAEAGLEHRRLLQWIAAWGGLSAAWTLEDGEDTKVPLVVAQNALALLDN